MTKLSFLNDYGGGLFSGQRVHDRLVQEGKTELVLTITSIRLQTFQDTEKPEWVLSFGPYEDELRLKKQLGRLLFDAFGNDGDAWIGKQIALWAEWITWNDKNGEAKEGYSLKIRPLHSDAVGTPPAGGTLSKRDLDDEIPF